MRNHYIYIESTYSRTTGSPVHSNMVKRSSNLIETHLVIFIQAISNRSKLFTFDYAVFNPDHEQEDRMTQKDSMFLYSI